MPSSIGYDHYARIPLPTGKGYTFFAIIDLLYFRADDQESQLYFRAEADGKGESKSEILQCRIFKGLQDLLKELKEYDFLQIRRDCLINSYHMKVISRDGTIIMTNGERFHPSRRKAKIVEEYLKDRFKIERPAVRSKKSTGRG